MIRTSPDRTASRPESQTPLELALPSYDFTERHSRLIHADADTVWRALSTLRMDHLRVTRPLVAVRHLGPNRGRTRRLFESGPVTMFDLAAPHYAIAGAIARPWQLHPTRHPTETLAEFARFDEPGWVTFLTDFRIEELGGDVRLSTQTRGRSTDAAARRRFAPYWWAIRPASGLIRRDILAAVARRAETEPSSVP